ncbi:unnamed protein product [Acanthoscelides obtectus]|nr:unnamed protein product [Acanthoscelides obtectus]CAK1655175.1 Chitotriosidase-1 [Acanthoscelides obtectus]
MDPYLDFDLGNIKRFNAMKEVNPSLKTLVAIGGWNEGSQKYSAVAASPSLRNTFVQSALKFVLDQGFDGFDLDWEYPARRGGSPTDKVNYVTLIKELKSAFEEHGLLLSAAVSATGETIDTSYNVTALSQYLDMINVMSYDLHGSWDKVTGHNAPLYPSNLDNTADSKELNLVSCAEAWLSRGASRSKLNLGLAFYGRSFTLSDAQNNGLGAPISAPGLPGRYSGESGMLTYYEIVEHLTTNEWTYRWDSEQEVPHIYKSNQWIGFDDANSIAKKVKYAKDEQLGGVMVWSVESDDFSGLSGIKYPLLRAAYQMAKGSSGVENWVSEVVAGRFCKCFIFIISDMDRSSITMMASTPQYHRQPLLCHLQPLQLTHHILQANQQRIHQRPLRMLHQQPRLNCVQEAALSEILMTVECFIIVPLMVLLSEHTNSFVKMGRFLTRRLSPAIGLIW